MARQTFKDFLMVEDDSRAAKFARRRAAKAEKSKSALKRMAHRRVDSTGNKKVRESLLAELSPVVMAQADVKRAQDLYAQGGRSPARQLRVAKQGYMQKPDPNEAPSMRTARMKVMRAKTMLTKAEIDLAKAQEDTAKGAPNGAVGTQKSMGPTGTGY